MEGRGEERERGEGEVGGGDGGGWRGGRGTERRGRKSEEREIDFKCCMYMKSRCVEQKGQMANSCFRLVGLRQHIYVHM